MRNKSHFAAIALWATISLAFPGGGVRAAEPGETVPGGQGGGLAGQIGEICFPGPAAVRMLGDLEGGLAWKAEAEACREWQVRAEERIGETDNLVLGLREEVRVERAGREEAVRQAERNLEAGRQAVKAAKGPWWSPILSAAKWIAVGILVGFVASAGR